MKNIDLNSDLGESFGAWSMGDDAAMLAIVTSANVACGFHAGDPAGLLKTLQAAARQGVAVGAHVSYPDLVGFGRRNMDISSEDLTAAVIYQIGALQGLAVAAGTEVRYVKPHGALYNTIAWHQDQGQAVIAAIQAIDPALPLVALAGSPLIQRATSQGIRVIGEAFADRGYQADGSLVPRSQPGAVLHDPEQVARRLLAWLDSGEMETVEGGSFPLQAQSICLHGDTPGAVAMAQRLRQSLLAQRVTLQALV